MQIAVVGTDLLTQSRVREAAGRLGASVTIHAGPGLPPADVVVVDLEALDPDSIPTPPAGTRVVGIYPHRDAELAARARRAGIEPVPRSRFARDPDEILKGANPRG